KAEVKLGAREKAEVRPGARYPGMSRVKAESIDMESVQNVKTLHKGPGVDYGDYQFLFTNN
ncbi:hypothetical protein THAOC_34582, partial [Thalassiosira oceanica]